MKKALLIILVFTYFWSSLGAQGSSTLDLSELITEQRQIIAALTGEQQIEKNLYLRARGTPSERRIARDYLKELIEKIPLKPVEHAYRLPNTYPIADLLIGPYRGMNIYGILPATDGSDEYVILGAHYDTEAKCPGANDNASAMALVYSVAKRLKKLEHRNKNLLFIFFDQEEEDLVGSKAFARLVQKEGYDIHSVHTIDQMGWDEDGDRAIELELPTKELEILYSRIGKELGIKAHITKVNSTDHQSFRALGYKAVGLTEEYVNKDTSPFKDTIDDTYETVNFEYLASSTNLVFKVFKEILSNDF